MNDVPPLPSEPQRALMRQASRALARHGLVHAYGHCSLRLDQAHFLVSPARPLGLVGESEPGIVVPLVLRTPGGTLRFISTTTIFGTPVDVTVSELTLETFFPADAETGQALRALADDLPG